MVELIISGNFIEIRNADADVEDLIYRTFRAKDPKAFYGWQKKRGFKTDGYIHLYDKKNKLLPIGFLPVLKGRLESKEVSVPYVVKNFNKPTPVPDPEKVDFDTILMSKDEEDGFFKPRYYQKDLVKECLKKRRGIVVGATGSGKEMPLSARIRIDSGWKRMGDVQVGDKICAADGTLTTVTGVFPQGKKDVYRLTFADGRKSLCGLEHQWKVFNHETEQYQTLKTKDLFKGKFSVPLAISVYNTEKSLPVNPYLFGQSWKSGKLPKKYLDSSNAQRNALLNGFINNPEFHLLSIKKLSANDAKMAVSLRKLVWSLGYECHVFKEETGYSVEIKNFEERYTKNRCGLLELVSVEHAGYQTEQQCISVEHEDKLYITNDYVVTHNTESFIMLSKIINRVTMILIDETQLAHQTYNRFLKRGVPEEDIGLFQSAKNRKFGKFNIVMVQSMKHFQPYLDKVEVIIVDECHMASSPRFQEILGPTDADLVFGFSATPFSSEDKVQRLRVISWLGMPIIRIPLRRLMDEGVLAMAYVRFVKIDNKFIESSMSIATTSTMVLDEDHMKTARGKIISKRMLKCDSCSDKLRWWDACDKCSTAKPEEIRKNMRSCMDCMPNAKNHELACDSCKLIPTAPKYIESFSSRAEGTKMSTIISPDQYSRKYKYVQTKMVDENEYRHMAAVNIIKKHKDIMKELGCIINFNFQFHGEAIYETLTRELPEYRIELIHGEKTNLKDRQRILQQFENKEIDIVIASTIWKKGIDIINVGLYVNLADMKDIIAAIQWLGRGVRKGEKKHILYYYDMWDSTNKTLTEHSKNRLKHYLSENLEVAFYDYDLVEQDYKTFKKNNVD